MDQSTFRAEVTRLIDMMGRPAAGARGACGGGEEPEVDDATGEPGGGDDEGIATLRKDGCSNSILLRAIDAEFRVEVQTVPQTTTLLVHARDRRGGGVEWVYEGRVRSTDELANDLAGLWSSGE